MPAAARANHRLRRYSPCRPTRGGRYPCQPPPAPAAARAAAARAAAARAAEAHTTAARAAAACEAAACAAAAHDPVGRSLRLCRPRRRTTPRSLRYCGPHRHSPQQAMPLQSAPPQPTPPSLASPPLATRSAARAVMAAAASPLAEQEKVAPPVAGALGSGRKLVLAPSSIALPPSSLRGAERGVGCGSTM